MASPLTSKYFLDYCSSRSIDIEVAESECCQVDYRLNGQMHSAIGFKNDKGGWELRSPMSKVLQTSAMKAENAFKLPSAAKLYGKICTCKAISTRKKKDGNQTVCVFEGFFDYLSFLTMMASESRRKCDYVILNSVSQASKAIPILRPYKSVRCYFDNDAAGRNAFEIVKKELNAISCSEKMLPYNDVNEYLCALMAEKPSCTTVDLDCKKCNSLRIAEPVTPVGRNMPLKNKSLKV